jgi:hypothetical protein
LLRVGPFRQLKETGLTPIKRRLKDNVFKVRGAVLGPGLFSLLEEKTMRLQLLAIATALAFPCAYAVADNEQHSIAPVAQQPQALDTDRTQSPGALEPDGRVRRDVRRYGDERVSSYSGDRYVYRNTYGADYSSGFPRQISPAANAPQVLDSDITMSPGAAEPDGSRMSPRRFRRS